MNVSSIKPWCSAKYPLPGIEQGKAAPVKSEWFDPVDAPDGESVLAYVPNIAVGHPYLVIASREGNVWRISGIPDGHEIVPKAWLPLPTPPSK